MLDRRRLDGIVGYEVNYDYALKMANWPTKYKKLPSFDGSVEFAAGAKEKPRVVKILKDFDAGKQIIVQNGKLNAIKRKWQGDNFEVEGKGF
jgi:hypothetical protein